MKARRVRKNRSQLTLGLNGEKGFDRDECEESKSEEEEEYSEKEMSKREERERKRKHKGETSCEEVVNSLKETSKALKEMGVDPLKEIEKGPGPSKKVKVSGSNRKLDYSSDNEFVAQEVKERKAKEKLVGRRSAPEEASKENQQPALQNGTSRRSPKKEESSLGE